MKIYYTYIPDKYEVNLYEKDLKDFKDERTSSRH